MTEAEWNACTDRLQMLEHLRSRSSERKLRLFAVGCCRRIWRLLTDERSRHLVEVLERYADGQAGDQELDDAAVANLQLVYELRKAGRADDLAHLAASAASTAAGADAWAAAWKVVSEARRPVGPDAEAAEALAQAALLRDLFGNPYRPPALHPAWRTPVVVTLAQAIYDWRAFDRLPGLANALAAAGCNDGGLLDHCCRGGDHIRGCWAVDLLLEKV